MELFRTKALAFSNAMLNYDSNLSLERNAWNIFIIETVFKKSGADDEDKDNCTKVDTAIDSHFWCGGTEHLICTNTDLATQITSRYVPQFDKILVLVNSDKYGGSGGNIATIFLEGGKYVETGIWRPMGYYGKLRMIMKKIIIFFLMLQYLVAEGTLRIENPNIIRGILPEYNDIEGHLNTTRNKGIFIVRYPYHDDLSALNIRPVIQSSKTNRSISQSKNLYFKIY